ncbi:hypothetical protein [Arcobacter sp. FWKO B]|uniref:hypothetical protein n=1 Tax=Arcobacter sp. FWKO B TaxID=2593672 RepID=UPI002B1BD17B
MVASQTHDVAVLTDKIAKLVVEHANEKEFIGKNDVKAQSMNKGSSQVKVPDVKKKTSPAEAGVTKGQTQSQLQSVSSKTSQSKTPIEKITPSQPSSDDWESF